MIGIYHTTSKNKTADRSVVISDKISLKMRNFTRDGVIMMKGQIRRE